MAEDAVLEVRPAFPAAAAAEEDAAALEERRSISWSRCCCGRGPGNRLTAEIPIGLRVSASGNSGVEWVLIVLGELVVKEGKLVRLVNAVEVRHYHRVLGRRELHPAQLSGVRLQGLLPPHLEGVMHHELLLP